MRLADKVALITGAGSGMGRAAALLFAAEGAAVAAIDIDEAAVLEVAKEITSRGGKAFGLRADVSNPADAENMVEETVKRFGKLNVLYNNAGIEGEANLTARYSLEGFERVIGINLRAVFLGMKYAIPHMINAGGGSIINTSSTAGLVGTKGGCAYTRRQAWRDRADQDRGDRVRTAQHPGQCNLPRPDRDAAAGANRGVSEGQERNRGDDGGQHSDRTAGRSRGNRQGGVVPGQ